MKAGENYLVSYKYKGIEYNIGLIEKDAEPGFWNWNLCWTDSEGIACSRRECRKEMRSRFLDAIENGVDLSCCIF